jgi:hypothetical protein
MATACALTGAVIVNQNGTTVAYRKKCEACGHVEQGTSNMQIPRGILSSSFFCSRCQRHQKIQIQGER